MALITLRMEVLTVLLVFSISLQHTAWSESLSGATNIDCPTPSLTGQHRRDNQCPASNFRVFNGPDVQDLEDPLPPDSPERLVFAAKSGESHVVRMTRSSQLGIAQEHASINIDCLPWLSRFPGGSIRWYEIQLSYPGSGKSYSFSFRFMIHE